MSATRDVGTNILSFIEGLDAKGKEFARNSRDRLRKSYIAAKNHGKFQDWTESNDEAFNFIDYMVIGLVRDAGFESVILQPQGLQSASIELFEAEAARRGMRVIPANAPPPPQRPAAPMAPPKPAPMVSQVDRAPVDLDEADRAMPPASVEDEINKLVRQPKT